MFYMHMQMTALEIDDNPVIPESIFRLPEDYVTIDMESLIEKTDGSPLENKVGNETEVSEPEN